MPKVSVCIPTYNQGRFIGQAIQSVLEQSFQDFELIIVDNCSTDNTQEVVKSFSDKRIKYFRNNTNIGGGKNWNKAISLATGGYISILHSDDFYLPGILEAESQVLDLNPNVGLVYSACRVISEKGEELFVYPLFYSDYINKGISELKTLLFNDHIPVPTVMVRKECYKKLGGFWIDNFNIAGDYEMWMRICLYYDIAYISKVLACYRIHKSQSVPEIIRTGLMGSGCVKIHKKFFSDLPPSASSLLALKNETLARDYLRSACNNCIIGNLSSAREDLISAVSEYPSLLQNPYYAGKFVYETIKNYSSATFLSTDYTIALDSFLSINNIDRKEIMNKIYLDESLGSIRRLIGSYYYNWGRFLYFKDKYKKGLKYLLRAFLNNPFNSKTLVWILKVWICLILPETILGELRLLNRKIKGKLSRT